MQPVHVTEKTTRPTIPPRRLRHSACAGLPPAIRPPPATRHTRSISFRQPKFKILHRSQGWWLSRRSVRPPAQADASTHGDGNIHAGMEGIAKEIPPVHVVNVNA